MADAKVRPVKHQKERAIALLTANGFLLFQVLSDPVRAATTISAGARLIFRTDTPDDLGSALLIVALMLAAPAFGVHESYRALQVADETDPKVQKDTEDKLDHALGTAVAVAIAGAAMLWLHVYVVEERLRQPRPTPAESAAPPAPAAAAPSPSTPARPPG